MTNDGNRRAEQLRAVTSAALVVAAVVALVVWQRARLADLPQVLSRANWAWIAAAVAVQGFSVACLARMQRALLGVDGVHRPIRALLATTYAGNAISQALPVVGSAASAMFAFRRFVALGVDRVVAGWALTVSGLYSTVSFVALAAGGALVTGSVGSAVAGLVTLVVGVVPAVVLLAGLQHRGIRRVVVRLVDAALVIVQRVQRRGGSRTALRAESGTALRAAESGTALRAAESGTALRAEDAVNQIAALHLRQRQALWAATFAVLNWAGDVACLVFALMAIGAPVPWHGLLLAWAAGAGASSLGLTPGGLGVVEGALSLALVASGLPAAVAVSTVLLYRFIKLWMVIAAGGVTLLVIRARPLTRARPERVPALLDGLAVLDRLAVLDTSAVLVELPVLDGLPAPDQLPAPGQPLVLILPPVDGPPLRCEARVRPPALVHAEAA